MPQASDELRAKFPGYDIEATDVLLSAGWETDGCGWWTLPAHEPTDREWDALDYLLNEWDHAVRRPGEPRDVVRVP